MILIKCLNESTSPLEIQLKDHAGLFAESLFFFRKDDEQGWYQR
jgi:hypothetical protein